MGRGGHGGGGFHGGGFHGGGFHGGGHHSSRGGFGGGYSSSHHHYHHHHYYGRRYYGGYGMNFDSIIVLLAIIFILIPMFTATGISSRITEKDQIKIEAAASDLYVEKFSGRSDVMLMVIAISSNENDEYDYTVYGSKCNRILDSTLDNKFYTLYDYNYNNDVGIQLANTLNAYCDFFTADGYTKITPDKNAFMTRCFTDNLGYIDSVDTYEDAARRFYNTTGIQFYVYIDKSSRIKKISKTKSSDSTSKLPVINILKIVKIIAIAAVSAIFVVIVTILGKKKAKSNREKRIKEAEEQIRILNTPLHDLAGTESDIDRLRKKYDSVYK